MKNFNKVLSLLLALMIAASVMILASCNSTGSTSTPSDGEQSQVNDGSPSADTSVEAPITSSAAGEEQYAYTFTFVVVDSQGASTNFTIKTNETTLRKALEQEGLIKGSESEFGLMVEEVNGIRAVYAEDQAYWALYIGEEYAMTGVDSTMVENGATYKFVYSKA